MTNQTQKDFVKDELNFKGYITRNECLDRRISRLGALICDLEKNGYTFTNRYYTVTKDYVYVMDKR